MNIKNINFDNPGDVLLFDIDSEMIDLYKELTNIEILTNDSMDLVVVKFYVFQKIEGRYMDNISCIVQELPFEDSDFKEEGPLLLLTKARKIGAAIKNTLIKFKEINEVYLEHKKIVITNTITETAQVRIPDNIAKPDEITEDLDSIYNDMIFQINKGLLKIIKYNDIRFNLFPAFLEMRCSLDFREINSPYLRLKIPFIGDEINKAYLNMLVSKDKQRLFLNDMSKAFETCLSFTSSFKTKFIITRLVREIETKHYNLADQLDTEDKFTLDIISNGFLDSFNSINIKNDF